MMNVGVEHCAGFVSSQFQPGGMAGAGAAVDIRWSVTISRQAGCGALAVAEKLARFLQERSSHHAASNLIPRASPHASHSYASPVAPHHLPQPARPSSPSMVS